MIATKTIPTISQFVLARPRPSHEEPDIPNSVHRRTEDQALRCVAMRARYRETTRGQTRLSQLHIELLRLERAALQYLPQLNYDERMEFIGAAANVWIMTARQIESMLDQASAIMALQEMDDAVAPIDDMTEQQTKRAYQAVYGRKTRGMRRMQARIPMASQQITAAR